MDRRGSDGVVPPDGNDIKIQDRRNGSGKRVFESVARLFREKLSGGQISEYPVCADQPQLYREGLRHRKRENPPAGISGGCNSLYSIFQGESGGKNQRENIVSDLGTGIF